LKRKNLATKNRAGISKAMSIALTIILLVAIAGAVWVSGLGKAQQNAPSFQTSSDTYAGSTIESTTHNMSSVSTSSLQILSTNTNFQISSMSSATKSVTISAQGSVSYSPSCFVLYSGGVHVAGVISPAESGVTYVKSVGLWWSYHAQNKWYPLNDLVLGSSFSRDGNFSHMWNPPSAGYYDFEANWTLSNGQTVSALSRPPFDVVAQSSTCP
jgi:hypothetical protein